MDNRIHTKKSATHPSDRTQTPTAQRPCIILLQSIAITSEQPRSIQLRETSLTTSPTLTRPNTIDLSLQQNLEPSHQLTPMTSTLILKVSNRTMAISLFHSSQPKQPTNSSKSFSLRCQVTKLDDPIAVLFSRLFFCMDTSFSLSDEDSVESMIDEVRSSLFGSSVWILLSLFHLKIQSNQ